MNQLCQLYSLNNFLNKLKYLIGVALIGILFTITMPLQATATVIQQIEINGLHRIEKATVLMYLNLSRGENVGEFEVNNAVKRLYSTKYFSNVNIDIKSDGTLSVTLLENPTINKVILQGAGFGLEKAIREEMQLKPRGVYTKDKVKSDTERIRAIYHKSGKLSASVSPYVQMLDNNKVNVIFDIKPGKTSRIASINFIGNKFFTKKDLKNATSMRKRSILNFISKSTIFEEDRIDSDKTSLTSLYTNNGFADFKVESSIAEYDEKNNNFAVTYYLDEGKRYRLGNLTMQSEVEDIDPKKIPLKILKIKSKDIYSYQKIQQSTNVIASYIANQGFAVSVIEPVIHKNEETGDIDITFVIKSSNLTYINRITIVGNNLTYDQTIRRELTMREGDLYNAEKIRISRERLEMLGYFSRVEIREKKTEYKDLIDLEIFVEEDRKLLGWAQVGVGYTTFEKFMVFTEITKRNLFGLGYVGSLGFTKSAWQERYSIGFTNPHLLGSDMIFGVDAQFVRFGSRKFFLPFGQRSESFGMRFGYPIKERLFHFINIQHRQDFMFLYSQAYMSSPLWSQIAGDRVSGIIGQGISYDKTDHPFLPTKGFLMQYNENYSGAMGYGNQLFISRELKLAAYVPLYKKDWILMLSASGGIIQGYGGKDVAFTNRYIVGYYNMRGFGFSGIGPRIASEDANGKVTYSPTGFRGNTYYILTAELIVPLPVPKEYGLRGAFFFDAANLYGVDGITSGFNGNGNKEYIVDSRLLRTAVGFGITWISPMGPIRVDFSKPLQYEPYDNRQTFRILFSVSPI